MHLGLLAHHCVLLGLVCYVPLAGALGQKPVVAFDGATAGSVRIAGGRQPGPGQIRVSANDYWGVIRAAGDLAADFGRVTGTNFTVSNGVAGAAPATYTYAPINNRNNTVYSTTGTSTFTGPKYADPVPANTVIIAGTIGHSTLIDQLVAAKTIDVAGVNGTWESFVSTLVASPLPGCPHALVIAGSDPRGTIYGLYDVSEQIGVSPWYFWADVPVHRHGSARNSSTAIYALPGRKVQTAPSVRYRGLFLNDEQPALTDWVASRWPDTPYGAGYGAAFYSLVFELLLRLRANYLWPAIWGSMFEVDDPANQPLADAFEVVLGSSHTEPMQRAQNEFAHFYAGPWAYNLNNATIDDYFRYGVQRAKPYARNSLWTMGMRGSGDTAIEGLGVDKIVTMLDTLVANQQRILAEGLGDGGGGSNRSVSLRDMPQMWCLYKEVQSYLSAGLRVPEDVTLLWADDNWGNVRRLPLRTEQARAGGAGVYYHFDYVGDPRNYKWINTVQLSKTAEQMALAYARGADRIWIVNVGDLKGLELPINHFLDMAYDAAQWGADSAGAWTTAWAEREFGSYGRSKGNNSSNDSPLAAHIADVVTRYSMLASRRKYELVGPETYSVLHYGEADAVLAQWAELVADAQAVYDALDAAAQPAFFEMVLHPVMAGAIVHRLYVSAAKNALYANQKRNAANDAIQAVLHASVEDVNLTLRWNALLDGKWNHMMDQTHLGYDGYWQQPMRNSLPALTYVQTAFAALSGEIGVGVEGSNGTVPGDDKYHDNSGHVLQTPSLDPYGVPRRYFEVFSRGTRACAWMASASVPWVHLSQHNGTVDPTGQQGSDSRIYVSVADWTQATTTTVAINVTSACRGLDKYGFKDPVVQVPVVVRTVPGNFTSGFIEADGAVSIDAAHYQAIVPPAQVANTTNATYHIFQQYGRTGSGVGLWPLTTEKLAGVAAAPALEYRLYLFSNTSGSPRGPANVTLYLSPTQNYLGDDTPLEYGIALYPADAASEPPTTAPTLVQPVGPSIGQAMPAGWGGAVADGVWGRTSNATTTAFAVPRPGAYTLRIWALLPSVIVQKIVVDLGGVRPSYLGPPESFLVGRDSRGSYNVTTFADGSGTVAQK
ncbi:hypothetical protein SPI_04387 [Niveomyces insectorum RCEF 264]|uniref:Gylcosyl hydrolase 115 C-terminal domain-containing protein n=1 Tax=Niveomyces insectorum RCEF 264 TaxID=1081102 RepID=A0A167VPE1_9HYPO|nr:hypothetical protein SPI_04387 [Niveomyces insectorum RCEF 264]